jgi:hypothetical protein
MIGAAVRYAELIIELLLKRALTDDNLSEDEEAAYADELDRCWWAMTKAEQDEIEHMVASQTSLEAPAELGERDTMVTRGSNEPPRKRIVEAEAA